MKNIRFYFAACLVIAGGLALPPAAQAAKFSSATQQVQSQLAQLGFNPGPVDGILGRRTNAAIKEFQKKVGLPVTGTLDSATLAKLDGTVPKITQPSDWRTVPTQDELDKLIANPVNDPSFPYTDYRPNAPAANLDLPGTAVLAAMKTSSNTFKSGPHEKFHDKMIACLKSTPPHWSDMMSHYYCQMLLPRICYTYAQQGKSKPAGKKYSRKDAYQGCATRKLPNSDFFDFVIKTQPQIFQYVMFGQTNAFKPDQEQAIINAFYGVTNPADPKECGKRPKRAEDPIDGTHCLANKKMRVKLVGKGS